MVGTEGSPFVIIFSKLGTGATAHILNFVVLTAAISVYNSGIYSNGRMLYGLAQQGNAPKIFMKLSANKVPYVGVLFSSCCTLAAVATTAAPLTWVMIVLVHIKFRTAHRGAAHRLVFPAPFFPYANYACVAFMVLIIAVMTQIDSMRNAVYVLPVWLAVLYVGFLAKTRMEGGRAWTA